MAKYGDRQLVRRCIEGDVEAWSEFVDSFSGLIYWAIKRKLNKYNCTYMESEIEEIYQRIFVSIWEKKSLMKVCERGNISPWLAVVASNLTIDFIREKSHEQDFLRWNLASKSRSQQAGKDILERDDKHLLDEAVKLLSEKEKAFLELNCVAGKKHREIAGIFNVSINSVSTIIARAKSKIKRHIESKR